MTRDADNKQARQRLGTHTAVPKKRLQGSNSTTQFHDQSREMQQEGQITSGLPGRQLRQ